jgi:hypothetical protein
MKNFRKDLKFWVIGITLSLISLVYIKLDSGSMQSDYSAVSSKSLLEEKTEEAVKIMNPDLIKKVSKAIYHLIIRD